MAERHGGERGIRTPGTLPGTVVFKTTAIDHSAISPHNQCTTDNLVMADVEQWLAALEERHLANLTRPELTRALRALSSCYVERRDRLAQGAALEGGVNLPAFALFYAPIYFL